MKIDFKIIPQNIAFKGVKRISLRDSNGNNLGDIPLGSLVSTFLGTKLYTFGALSDVHLPNETAEEDFAKALTFFNTQRVNFICICGDVSNDGSIKSEMLDYKNHVDTYSPNIDVHLAYGNHDAANHIVTYEEPIQYTGNPLYYSFKQNDDLFVIFGMQWWGDTPFSNESLQWLYETLEQNRNKRVFVFQHMMRLDGCGDAHDKYTWDGLNNTHGRVFLSLMEHYTNVLWFHGHSHTKFALQYELPSSIANYDRLFGCHSIHIPSLSAPRDKEATGIYAEAEGYIVDVYKDGIHLKGRDFVGDKFIPIASYWIDTTIREIPPKEYNDPNGIITT